MKYPVEPEVLRLRERESHKRLELFMGVNRVLARAECLHLLNRLVGDENYDTNFKTVLYVIRHYFDYRWMRFRVGVSFWYQEKVLRKTPEEIETWLERD